MRGLRPVQIAASIRVGHHLGANAPAAARLATRTAVGGIVVLSGLMGVALLWLQPLWARLYTTDPEALAGPRPAVCLRDTLSPAPM